MRRMGRPKQVRDPKIEAKRDDLKTYDSVTVYLTPETVEKLKTRAKQLSKERNGKVTVTDVVRELLGKYL